MLGRKNRSRATTLESIRLRVPAAIEVDASTKPRNYRQMMESQPFLKPSGQLPLVISVPWRGVSSSAVGGMKDAVSTWNKCLAKYNGIDAGFMIKKGADEYDFLLGGRVTAIDDGCSNRAPVGLMLSSVPVKGAVYGSSMDEVGDVELTWDENNVVTGGRIYIPNDGSSRFQSKMAALHLLGHALLLGHDVCYESRVMHCRAGTLLEPKPIECHFVDAIWMSS
jgi:hypothetical protein